MSVVGRMKAFLNKTLNNKRDCKAISKYQPAFFKVKFPINKCALLYMIKIKCVHVVLSENLSFSI